MAARWSRDHDACIGCDTTARPHRAHGRCKRCDDRWHYSVSKDLSNSLRHVSA